ncbi:MAG: superoxide dismutase family protein [Oscillospiraceae bacterium]|nr:superoxide dismutase family protein [Oscillospiraceae bacterium]
MDYYSVFSRKADAAVCIKGSRKYPSITGKVRFYQMCGGVMMTAEVGGLPIGEKPCGGRIFGFHIHDGTECSGNKDAPFANAKGHYNPHNCEHPYHAGDMPPLFGVNGKAFLAFMTDRFNVTDIIGKAVIIHGMPDDFHTQPSGNAGEMIACGIVESSCR